MEPKEEQRDTNHNTKTPSIEPPNGGLMAVMFLALVAVNMFHKF